MRTVKVVALSAALTSAALLGSGRSMAGESPAALPPGSAIVSSDSRLADSLNVSLAIADLDSAWANGDADRWARGYAADAEFINILGMLFPDTKSMRARHHEIFTGVFRGSRHEGTIRRMRFPAPHVAIVDVDIAVTGFQALPPGTRPTEPGVLRTRMRHVFQKTDGTWRIIATQNTAIAPKP